jgi:hypothetical protein
MSDGQKLIPEHVKQSRGIDNAWKKTQMAPFAQYDFFSNLSAMIPLETEANNPPIDKIAALMRAYYGLKDGKFLPKKTGR